MAPASMARLRALTPPMGRPAFCLCYSGAGTEVSLCCSREGADAIRVTVQDTGPGIADVDLPHVFEPFFRGRRSSEEHGAGLGLAIAKTIVESHGGRLWAEAGPSGGARFVMVLPVVAQAAHNKPELAVTG